VLDELRTFEHDGTVRRAEFCSVLRHHGLNAGWDTLEEFFGLLDRAGAGRLPVVPLGELLRRSAKARWQASQAGSTPRGRHLQAPGFKSGSPKEPFPELAQDVQQRLFESLSAAGLDPESLLELIDQERRGSTPINNFVESLQSSNLALSHASLLLAGRSWSRGGLVDSTELVGEYAAWSGERTCASKSVVAEAGCLHPDVHGMRATARTLLEEFVEMVRCGAFTPQLT
jgi:hypothetical protein